MDTLIPSIVAWALAGLCACQNDPAGRILPGGGAPPASILLHKQALGRDGSFNYAFATDNGLRQGEVIDPDGSRKGSYSYVDPDGKTVTLSYTAGKDGFRVLDGDHVPKAPEPARHRGPFRQTAEPHPYLRLQLAHRPQARLEAPAPLPRPEALPPLFRPEPLPYEAYKNAPNAPVYGGHLGTPEEAYPGGAPRLAAGLPHGQYLREPPRDRHPHGQVAPFGAPPSVRPPQYGVREGVPAHLLHGHRDDRGQAVPGRGHSFGDGYSFEFAG